MKRTLAYVIAVLVTVLVMRVQVSAWAECRSEGKEVGYCLLLVLR